MMLDTSGQLQTLVEKFVSENNEAERKKLVPQLIYKWTGKTTNLAAIEALTGVKYTGGTGTNATAAINKGFDSFAKIIYEVLMSQSHYKYLYEKMHLDNTGANYSISAVSYELLCLLFFDQEVGEKQLIDFINNMYALRMFDSIDRAGFQETFADYDYRYGLIADIVNKNIFLGTSGNDNITGTSGNDAFFCGVGNNTFNGNYGDDTFFFDNGSGTNTFYNASGSNTVILSGVNSEGFSIKSTLNSKNKYNIEITFAGINGKMIIADYMYEANYTFVFPDGSTIELAEYFPCVEIETAEQLRDIQKDRYGNYRLISDIDLSGEEWTPIGTSSLPFYGMLDGNGYIIKNLNINKPSGSYIGLFGYNLGTIKNLTLESVNITGRDYTGCLVGRNAGAIKHCLVKGVDLLSGYNYVGGLSGSNESNGYISNSTVESILVLKATGSYSGGFIGLNSGSVIDCSAGGISSMSVGSYVGGFVGHMSGGSVLKSLATGNMKGAQYVGGFVGYVNNGAIEQCYATGNIDGSSYLGGFAGYLNGPNGVIRNCFSRGNVASVSNTAGFVGNIASGKVENCYSTASNPNGFSFSGTASNCFFNSTVAGATLKAGARSIADMKKSSTYAGWNFIDIWEINEGDGYPALQRMTVANPDFGNYTEIYTAEDLDGIRKDLFGMYRLMADIDLAGIAWTPIGTAASPFAGVLDGNGYSVKNLSVNLTAQDYVGLFGYSKGTIMNLTVEGAEVKGKSYVGVLAGYSTGNVTDVTVNGVSVLSGTSYIGGLVGYSTGNITGCAVSKVTTLSSSSQYAGGLVGYSASGISNSTVNEIGTLGGGSYVGGYVGYNGGTIRDAYAASTVKGSSYVGGFVGQMSGGTIERCYATGNIDGTSYLGGFAGQLSGTNSVIRNSFSMGNVASGSNTAGFVGNIASGKVENCYSTASHSNGFHTGVAVTSSYYDSTISGNTAKTEGRTTADMKKAATYSNWDFETVWEMDEGYPVLRGLDAPNSSVGNYTEIYTAEDLDGIRKDLFGMYRLMADIDLAGIAWTPIGTAASPFAGVLDGNGYSVKNLSVNLTAQDYVGLFGYSKGTIMNLTVEGAEVKGKSYVGVLAGYSTGNVTDVTVNGVSVLSGTSYIGGLVGYSSGMVENCEVKDVKALTGTNYIGGLIGQNAGTIESSTVVYVTTNSNGAYVGGFTGYNTGTIINGNVNGWNTQK